MKVVFLHKLESFMGPIGLCQIAAVAERAGHTVYYLDMNMSMWRTELMKIAPDVVACSVMTGEAKHYYDAADVISKLLPKTLLVAGGTHPTFFPEMVKESAFHIVCRGEGELAFSRLLTDVRDGAQLPELKDIPNMVTATTHDPMNVNMWRLQERLDDLPPPLWKLIYDNTHLGANPLKIYMTGRGCPFSCAYCASPQWRALYPGQGAGRLRKYSVDYIIDDLACIMFQWPLEYVKFYDDVFITQADDWFYLIMNRTQSDEALIVAHAICREHKISTFTNVMVGLPDTNHLDDLESLELAIRCQPTWIEFPIYEPYPRTELGDYTFSKGYADHDWRKIHTSYQYRSRLSYFTEQEKDIQVNFGTLGVIATLYVRFHYWITSDLIHRKPNRWFLFAYFLIKMVRMQKKIYPTGLNVFGRLKIYYRSIKQELWRHSSE
jgi:radical SAM superfamily enzyme YgiQ (UPF0313 family)